MPSKKTQFKKNQVPWNKGKILVPLDEQRKKRNKRRQEQYAKDVDKFRKKGREWYQKNKEKESKRNAIYRKKYEKEIKQRVRDVRLEVLTHYSKAVSNSDIPICACAGCGEKHIEFLVFDHINGRKSMGHKAGFNAEKLCRNLRKNGYPKGIQVLCANCNHSKHDNGFCFVHEWHKYHQKKKS